MDDNFVNSSFFSAWIGQGQCQYPYWFFKFNFDTFSKLERVLLLLDRAVFFTICLHHFKFSKVKLIPR